MNPILARIVGALVSLAIAFSFGVLYERGNLKEYQGEVKGAVSVQEQVAKAADTKNEGDAHASEQSIAKAVSGVYAYYDAHPVVRVQHDGSCAMPKAAGDTQSVDGAAPGLYASPYSPRDTELVAARLDELQKRLIAGGVKIN